MKIIKADGKNEVLFLKQLRQRSEEVNENTELTVKNIIENVKLRKDEALFEYSRKFDKVDLSVLEVAKKDIDESLNKEDKDFLKALEQAALNIREFHEHQKQNSWEKKYGKDTVKGQLVKPLKRVGIYVPGGTAAYPSSVLMNAIPAKVAGVSEIIMVTPPAKDGKANPDILAAAKIAGVDRVFLTGGAQAVAALAYGTQSIPKVDKIVGPGNIYVAVAKKLVFGQVDIDMIAGPSEILIIADETANPVFLAADMLSQAEHDIMASSILVTTSEETAIKTISEIEKQLNDLSRKEIAEKSIENFAAVIICDNINKAIEISNEIAPEHLEIVVKDPFEILPEIENAGSIFLGEYSPEPLGDYMAGPNHVLPTSGTARFFSPLGVDSFIKKSSYIYFNKEALGELSDKIITVARKEGLDAHANSIKVRFKK